MKKNNIIKSINIITVIIIVLIMIIVYFALTKNTEITGTPIEITIQIPKSDSSENIYTEAKKTNEVFLNSVNFSVETLRVEKDISGIVYITLKGKGEIDNDRYIFNGQRVLVGQKTEIHGKYFAQGTIKDVKKSN